MVESKAVRKRKPLEIPSATFPDVNVKGDKICPSNGLYEGSEVTSDSYSDRLALVISPIKDLSIYNIKDYSRGHNYKKPVTRKGGTKLRSSNGVQHTPISRRESPSLLEQSRSLQGFRKQITNRLGDAETDVLLETKPIARKLSPLSQTERITSKMNGVAGCDLQISTKTVYLKNRGIHVRVTETPKEAMARHIRQRSPETVSRCSSALTKEDPVDDLRLMVHGVVSSKTNDEEDNKKSEISSYAIRQQYGQHLEKNWYKSLLREMNTKTKVSVTQQNYPFTPDMFYSPEPESDSEEESWDCNLRVTMKNVAGSKTNISGCESDDDILSLGGDEPTPLLRQSTRFASMDVLVSDNGSEDGSDVEFVLKNGELIQKKVQNKMLKKRQRQFERFQKYTSKVDEVSDDTTEFEVENMTDKELRAMRLKLKRPKWKLKLKGIMRFRQVVRCICILLFFRRLLKQIKKDRRERMKRNKRHKSLGGFLSGEDDDYGRFSRNQNRYRSLKERFLGEIGWKLVEQVSNLAIQDGFGYDIRDELASGERRSRYLRVLDEWFPADDENYVEIPDIQRGRSRKVCRSSNRSSSCPEFIKPKQYRVLFGPTKVESEEFKKNASRKSGKKGSKKKGNQNQGFIEDNDDVNKYAIGKHFSSGRRSSFELNNKKNRHMDLRDLLKDVNIPAKEIKIQIAERKMRRNKRNGRQTKKKAYVPYDAKKAIEANRFKIPDFDLDLTPINTSPLQNDLKSETPTSPDQARESPTKPASIDDKLQNFCVMNKPFNDSSVSENKPKQQKQTAWTNEELDEEIRKAGSLFLEMRHCRYIRWDRLGQAMVTRLMELENEMYGFASQI